MPKVCDAAFTDRTLKIENGTVLESSEFLVKLESYKESRVGSYGPLQWR